ncbi:MAG: ATP-binding protein [Bacteroidetes bacterium]|nr:ATP-binding protein [Bacteroidota bacterium]MCL5035394.1 ATP-binding protein [Bacteroidota bacterium]
MMFLSIRLKLTIWYSLVLLIALGTFGVTAYLYTGETLTKNLNISLTNETEWLREILEGKLESERGKMRHLRSDIFNPTPGTEAGSESEGPGESAEDFTIWNKIYEHSLVNSKKQFVYIFDKRGRVFYKSFNLREDTLPTPPAMKPDQVSVVKSRLGDQNILLAAMNTRFYRIRVAYPEEEINEVLRNLFSIFLFLIPIVLLISVTGGYFLAKQSLRPVDEITQTTREITATNLKQRMRVKNPKDEIGRLTETLNDMISRLETSFEQVGQFSMDASHELRTPLTIMRGEIELALQEKRTTESYRETLASLLDEVIRMSSIVEGLILLSKADSGIAKLDRKQMRLDLLVSEIKEDAEVLAEQKKIRVSVSKLDESTVVGDPIRLRQLMLNLVDNAIKYTPEGGKVILSLARRNGDVWFSVEDSGIGIPEKDLKRIFDRFYRVDKSRSRLPDGLGLGLSISKWVAEAHGGRIYAESKVGSGTKFTVVLPVNAPSHN